MIENASPTTPTLRISKSLPEEQASRMQANNKIDIPKPIFFMTVPLMRLRLIIIKRLKLNAILDMWNCLYKL